MSIWVQFLGMAAVNLIAQLISSSHNQLEEEWPHHSKKVPSSEVRHVPTDVLQMRCFWQIEGLFHNESMLLPQMWLSWLAGGDGTAPAPTEPAPVGENKLFVEVVHRAECDSQSAAWGSVAIITPEIWWVEELEPWDEEGVGDINPKRGVNAVRRDENVKAMQMNKHECCKMDLRGVTDEGSPNTKFVLMSCQNFLHKILYQKSWMSVLCGVLLLAEKNFDLLVCFQIVNCLSATC